MVIFLHVCGTSAVHGVYDSMELLQHTLQMVNRPSYPLPIKPDFQDTDSYKLLEWGVTVIPLHQLLQGVPSKLDLGSIDYAGIKNDGIRIFDGSCGRCKIIFTDGNCNRHCFCKTTSFQVF